MGAGARQHQHLVCTLVGTHRKLVAGDAPVAMR